MKRGILIAIEGIDASGKETQTKLLAQRLKQSGFKTAVLSFPDYQTKSGQQIKQRLLDPKWVYSNPKTDGFPELFASNFAEKRADLENYLKKGFIVVCDRYEPSNEAYQSAKLPKAQQESFRKYIKNLYFEKHKLPKPDLIIFLDLSLKLCEILKKNRKEKDAFEKTLPFLERVYKTYQNLTKEKNWLKIKCFKNKKIFEKEEIAKKIWQIVSKKSSAQK